MRRFNLCRLRIHASVSLTIVMQMLYDEIETGVDLDLIRSIVGGNLSRAAVGQILRDEASGATPLCRCTISILNILENLASAALPLPNRAKSFWVKRSRLVHTLLKEGAGKNPLRNKARLLAQDLDLVLAAAHLMIAAGGN